MSLRRKIGFKIAGVKSAVDAELMTSRGNYFFRLTSDVLGKMFSVVWGKYSDRKLIEMYHTMAEVYSPVYHRASRVSQGVFVVKRVSNGEPVYSKQELNRLLEQPNESQNFQELIYQWEAYECVTGKNFIYANIPDSLAWDYKNVMALRNLPADTTEVKMPATVKLLSATEIKDVIKSFSVSIGNTVQPVSPDKVLYTKYPSLYAEDMSIIGRSPLLSSQKAMDNLKLVYAARHSAYKKRGALGFITSRKADADGMSALTPAETKEIREQYEKDYGVGEGQSPTGIISSPVDFVKVGATIQEMQPFEETRESAMAVYSSLMVPRSLMPSKEGSTYANQKEEEKAFYLSVIIPSAKKKAQSLTNFLRLKEVGLYIDVSFDHVEVLQENKKEKSDVDWKNNETCRVRFMNGIITLNDWRVTVGLEKVKNPLYDTLIYEMAPDQLESVGKILQLAKGVNPGNNQNQDNNASGNQQ